MTITFEVSTRVTYGGQHSIRCRLTLCRSLRSFKCSSRCRKEIIQITIENLSSIVYISETNESHIRPLRIYSILWRNKTVRSVPTQNRTFCNTYPPVALCPHFCLQPIVTHRKTYILMSSNSYVVHLLRKWRIDDKFLAFHTVIEKNMFLFIKPSSYLG